jgi:hypothetical protein
VKTSLDLLGLAVIGAAVAAGCSDEPPQQQPVYPVAGTGGGGTTGGGGGGGAGLPSAGLSGGGSGGSAGNTTAGGGAGGGAGAGSSLPSKLSETGLFSDVAAQTLAPGVFAFEPKYALWSDAASKRRWVYLPPGKQINTDQMDFWEYPEGMKLWKEFKRDGVLIETRLIMKKGQGLNDWYMVAYKWNADQSDAEAVPMGELNAMNTKHDIPSQEQCSNCHQGMWDNVLGFSAVQLSHDKPGTLTLSQAATLGWFSKAPAAAYDLPGSAEAQEALGYLHANCGMCHNEVGKLYLTKIDLDLWTHVDQIGSVEATRAYLSTTCDQWPGDKFAPITACQPGHATGAALQGTISKVAKRVTPKSPQMSAIRELMSLRGDENSKTQMPPLGTEDVDTAGLEKVDAWINTLQ